MNKWIDGVRGVPKFLSENLFIFKWDYAGHDSQWVDEWMNELLNVIIGSIEI